MQDSVALLNSNANNANKKSVYLNLYCKFVAL